MRYNEVILVEILLALVLISCATSRTADEEELQNTIDAVAMISAQGNNAAEFDDLQNNNQQEFDEQQELDEQQEFNGQQDQQQIEQQGEDINTQQNNVSDNQNKDEFDEYDNNQNDEAFRVDQDLPAQQITETQDNAFGQQFEQSNEQTMFNTNTQESVAEAGDLIEVSTDEGDNVNDLSDEENNTLKMGLVHWIGYVYKQEESLVNVEIVTKNNPQFDIYQEVNRAKQKEIVIRYYNTQLRKKLRRDIDASEFRSPVAYIRTRNGDEKNVVEVVLTIRNEVEAKYLAKDGHLLLSFPIPSHYFGDDKATTEPSAQAADLSTPLIVVRMENSAAPRSGKVLGYVFNREIFKNVDISAMETLPEGSLSFNDTEPADYGETAIDNSIPAENTSTNNENNNFQQNDNNNLQNNQFQENNNENLQEKNNNDYQSDDNDNFQENDNENLQENDNENFQENDNENFQENDNENFQENDNENFQENDNENFQENSEQQTSLNKQQTHTYALSSEIIFLHVGQDPADDFSTPDSISDGSTDANGLPVAETAETTKTSNNDNNTMQQEMGQVKVNNENNENNNANLEEALLDEDSLLAPLHGTEAIGSERLDEDIAVSDVKAVRMVFRDAPLSEVLHAIRTETGTNFIFQPAIGSRKIFLNLSNVPWDEALRALLEVNNLAMAKIGDNLVRVDTIGAISSYKKEVQSLKIQNSRLKPTKVMILKLSHADAGTVVGMIDKLLAKVMKEDERIKVQTDERTNSLLIEALPEDLAKIRVLVDRLDYRSPQVKIATRIVEVLSNNDNAFGISWQGPINYDQSRGLGFGSLLFPNFATASFAIDGGGGTGAAGGVGGSFGVHFGSLNDSIALDLRLQMSEIQGKTEVLQTNNIVVQDGKGAQITAGTSDIFTVSTPEGGTTIQTVNYNVNLDVTPRITADNSVTMMISIRSDNPSDTGAGLTAATTRNIRTELLRQSGETIAIGGLYTMNKTSSRRGVPILSSIPILGALFRSYHKNISRRELIFLVTPTILHSGKAGDDDEVLDTQINNDNNFNNDSQFQQNNQQNFDNNNIEANNINAQNPTNAEWQNNNTQFQQQDTEQNLDQNNNQLDNMDNYGNENDFEDENNLENENIANNNIQNDIDNQQNVSQEQNILTTNNPDQDLGNEF